MTPPKPSLALWLADRLRELQAIEEPLVNLISAASPYIAPVFPALYTWHSVTYVLLATWDDSIAWWVGLATAVGVEFIGVSAVQTSIKLWDEKRMALMWLAVAAGLYYVAVVVVSNVLLGIMPNAIEALVTVSALLSSQTVVGGLISGVRAQATKQVQAAQSTQAAIDAQQAAKQAQQREANATAFEQGRQVREQQNAHELAQLAARNAQELALAQERTKQLAIEAEIARASTPPAPVIDPASTGQVASVEPELASLVAEFRASNASSKSISKDLCIYLHGKGYTNTEIANATGIHITGVGKHINGSKNGAKA